MVLLRGKTDNFERKFVLLTHSLDLCTYVYVWLCIYGRMSDFICVYLIMTEFYDCHNNSWLSNVDKLIIKLSTATTNILFNIKRCKIQAQVCMHVCTYLIFYWIFMYTHTHSYILLYIFRKQNLCSFEKESEESFEEESSLRRNFFC